MTYEDLFGVHTVTMVTIKWMGEMSVFLLKEHCYIGGTLVQILKMQFLICNFKKWTMNNTYFFILLKLYQFLSN